MPEHVAAEYGIPHCDDFKATPDGFSLSFRKLSILSGVPVAIVLLIFTHLAVWAATNFSTNLAWFVGISGTAFALYYPVGLFRHSKAHIEVTRDAVLLNGKRFDRADFGAWHLFASKTVSTQLATRTFVTLGYTYGNRSFPFEIGGPWQEREATEFVSALNQFMRFKVPNRNTAPEELRAAATSDF